MLYRQGDVLIVPVKSIPKGAKPVPRENGRVILAHGEVTGHAHALLERNVNMVEKDMRRFLEIAGGGASVVHEEHGTIKLDAGLYEVIRQREYSPAAFRYVTD